MLPKILQPAQYGTPVASLTIDGLGICCFNANASTKQWEVAFLRNSGHQLKINVKKVDQRGKIVCEFGNDNVLMSRLIRFSVDNGSEEHYRDFPQGFFKAGLTFSRSGDDSYDYRWVIDAVGSEVPHDNFLNLIPYDPNGTPPRVYVTIVTIPYSLFYTERVTKDSVIFTPRGKGPNEGTVLGRSNEEVGAAIYSKRPGEVRLSYINGIDVLPETMPYDAGFMYEISLLNMDVSMKEDSQVHAVIDGYARGDFYHYYEVLKVPEDTKQHQDLLAPRRTYRPRALDGDCHVVGGGHILGNLPSLMDLITSEP